MLVDRTSEPLMRLLVDATRRAETSGASLAKAHRAVGRSLAQDVANDLVLEETPIAHSTGPASGVRLPAGSEPIIIASLRSGLFLAEGIWESIPGSSLMLHDSRIPLANLAAGNRPVVLVDAVLNTGASMRALLQQVLALRPARIMVVILVGYRPSVEALAAEFPGIRVVAARVSDRSYVGRGPTDTGARLFGP